MIVWFTHVTFCYALFRLWLVDGPKLPSLFIALWLSGAVASALLGLNAYYFMSFVAILAVIVLFTEGYIRFTEP